MNIQNYIENINTQYQTGFAREHTYRGDLQNLLEHLTNDILVTNEPARIECGSPDYVLTYKEIPVGYIEAKDIGDKDLEGKKTNKEQFSRYKKSLDNLIFTDYLNFYFYRNGKKTNNVIIGKVEKGKIKPVEENFESFTQLIKDFTLQSGQTIKEAKKLAIMMASKAKLLAGVIEKALNSDVKSEGNTELKNHLKAFKETLIKEITPKQFADIYAQTIAYGMFAARLYDEELTDFSRQKAASLIPKSNPFLRKWFQYISGYDIDDRIEWIVTDLADIFRATDVRALLNNFGKTTQTSDPIIHFYETFLAAYDPKLRKARGVWYTPAPVVDFMVRAVDDILKTEFGLSQGLADNSKIKIKVKTKRADNENETHENKNNKGGGKSNEPEYIEKEVHRVQILDPATGTATFLAAVIQHLYQMRFKAMQGAWSSYVENDLIPRLHGFELLMAPYTIAHLKLGMLLEETGFQATKNQRFNIYLTNALEDSHKNTGTLLAEWLSKEANEANRIKRETPVMVVLGNPPYSGHSANKGDFLAMLLDDYKKEPDSKQKLQERNPKWLNDDYVKFIRYGQYLVDKNQEGIVAYITNHSFLDNPTFRGMRWHLLNSFDKIYIIDAHGNAKKKEVSPDGSVDQNVFDIQQGVSINIFVKTSKKKTQSLAKVLHYDLYGNRAKKYNFFQEKNLQAVDLKELKPQKSNFFFVQKDYSAKKKYDKGFKITDLFPINGVGITTAHDDFVIDNDKNILIDRYKKFQGLINPSEDFLHKEFNVKKKKGWSILDGWQNLRNQKDIRIFIKPINYRPFDTKNIFYEPKLVWRRVFKVMQHFLKKEENLSIVFRRQQPLDKDLYVFCTNAMVADGFIRSDNKGSESVAPLYIYPTQETFKFDKKTGTRKPNLNQDIVKQIAKKLKLTFTNEKETTPNTFAPIDILDYIYAVLHSPNYREKYKEFLKIDFPRVPYPNPKTFWPLVELGKQLRSIHLLESPTVETFITTYPEGGDNIVTRRMTKTSLGFQLIDKEKGLGKVWINDQQYFGQVPKLAWEFYIGGYQPAQKWLKDRKGRTLTFDDIMHYQKIIVALTETDRLMKEIDKINIL